MDSLLLVLRVLVSLAVVVALVWYLARRFGGRSGERSREVDVHVVDRQSLSRHSGVAVVAVGDRRLLVGFADQNIRLITELAPVPAAPKVGVGAVEPAAQPLATSPAVTAPALAPAALPSPRPKPAPRPAAVPVAAAAATGLPGGRRPSPLAGSVLSPATWQATVRAMQDRTVRR